MSLQKNITATVFGGSSDRETSAYDGHRINDAEMCCALPFNFGKNPPVVRIWHNGKNTDARVEDIGPWNTKDPYWLTGKRPQAESGHDLFGRRTNHAGIDLSPAVARNLGISGMGTVDWQLVDELGAEPPAIPPDKAPDAPAGLTRQVWPHENMHDLCAFYGDPRGAHGANPTWARNNLVTVTPPWKMNASGILIHHKCAESLRRVLNAAWDHVGKDQSKIHEAHLDVFDGSFNYRPNRNNPSVLSMHSFGIALDLAAAWNPNGVHWHDNGRMLPRWFINLFLEEGWSWGGSFHGVPDPMHFEATNLGQHEI